MKKSPLIIIGLLIFSMVICSKLISSEVFSQAQEINNQLAVSAKAGYNYENINQESNIYFKSNLNSADGVRFEKDGYFFVYDLSGSQMLWKGTNTQPSASSTIGGSCPSNSQDTVGYSVNNAITYTNAFCNTDINYQVLNNEVKETIRLNSLPSIKNYLYLEYSGNIKFNKTLQICTDDKCYIPSGTLDDFETSGKIYFKDMNGTTRFWLEEPKIRDRNGNTILGTYKVHGSNAQMNFWLRIPTSYLKTASFPIYIDPTITFDTIGTMYTSFVFPVDEHTIGVAWQKITNTTYYPKKFTLYDTNGTRLFTPIQVIMDTGISTTAAQYAITGAALTNNRIIITYHNYTHSAYNWKGYYRNGTIMTGQQLIMSNVGGAYAVYPARLTNKTFAVTFADRTGVNCYGAAYYYNGTTLLAPTVLSAVDCRNAVSIARVSNLQFAPIWYDYTNKDITWGIWAVNGTNILAEQDIDTDVTTSYSVSNTMLTNNIMGYGYYDNTDNDITVGFKYKNGTALLVPTDIDTDVTTSRAVQVFRVSNSSMAGIYYDNTDKDDTMFIINTAGTLLLSPTDLSTNNLPWNAPSIAGSFFDETGICDGNFIVSYLDDSSDESWGSYYPNGTLWDGICTVPEPPEPPAANCTCPSLNTNWNIDMANYCELTANCNIGKGIPSFHGTGNFTIGSGIIFNCTNPVFNTTGNFSLRSNAIWNINN